MIDVTVPMEQEGTKAVVRAWLKQIGDRVEGSSAEAQSSRKEQSSMSDADDETHRRWLAASPWPEVVFASAGRR